MLKKLIGLFKSKPTQDSKPQDLPTFPLITEPMTQPVETSSGTVEKVEEVTSSEPTPKKKASRSPRNPSQKKPTSPKTKKKTK